MPTLLYIGQNPSSGTGSPVILLRHLRRFAADGWRVIVLADYGGNYTDCSEAGFEVVRLCHRRWWWPPYREGRPSLRWLRLHLLAREVSTLVPAPDVILGYLAAHSDFTADLAGHVAQVIGAPLHLLVHDDATAFPGARERAAELRRAHENILRSATVCWYVSPELADCFPATAPRRRVLYPLPEGWNFPAVWRNDFARRPRIYYAGHVWPEQHALLARLAHAAREAGAEFVIMARDSVPLRTLCATHGIRWQSPFPTNPEALGHLVANAAAVVVSYADSVAAMPWCATSFPSKLVEYTHLGLPVVVVAPGDSAVARWAERTHFPHFFAPSNAEGVRNWFAGLVRPDVWQERAQLSLHLARTEFDPDHIQAQLASAILPGTESRAA